jgi:hypothetical protein
MSEPPYIVAIYVQLTGCESLEEAAAEALRVGMDFYDAHVDTNARFSYHASRAP